MCVCVRARARVCVMCICLSTLYQYNPADFMGSICDVVTVASLLPAHACPCHPCTLVFP